MLTFNFTGTSEALLRVGFRYRGDGCAALSNDSNTADLNIFDDVEINLVINLR